MEAPLDRLGDASRLYESHLFASQTGVSYTFGNLTELGLSYNHVLTLFRNIVITYGNPIWEADMTNQYFQFKIAFRQ